jgi:predicted histone-like DNA-binding protein
VRGSIRVARRRLALRGLTNRISLISTVSNADTLAVLESLLTVVPEELTKGNIVELGDLGTFRLRVRTSGSEQAAQVGAGNILAFGVLFKPGKLFKRALQGIRYRKA